MPTAEQVKQFIVGVVIPPLAGVAATWITVHAHFLALFHIQQASIAGEIAQVSIYLAGLAIAWLTAHHILKGHYTPAAKANTNV